MRVIACVVVPLEREAIPDHTPGLRALPVVCDSLLREVRQVQLLLQMPQGGGVRVQGLRTVWVDGPRCLECLLGSLCE